MNAKLRYFFLLDVLIVFEGYVFLLASHLSSKYRGLHLVPTFDDKEV